MTETNLPTHTVAIDGYPAKINMEYGEPMIFAESIAALGGVSESSAREWIDQRTKRFLRAEFGCENPDFVTPSPLDTLFCITSWAAEFLRTRNPYAAAVIDNLETNPELAIPI